MKHAQELFDFLAILQENNHKDWMDANRTWYKKVRDIHIAWLTTVNDKLAEVDPNYYDTPGKKGINRINNNLLFHPNLPVYKDHFGAGFDKAPNSGDFYLELGVNSSMMAGGFYRPHSNILKRIRAAIDYDGEVFKAIIEAPKFKAFFKGLITDDILKNSPKGYAADHPHIELLKYKTFAVRHELNQEDIFASSFDDYVVEVYEAMLPFRNYLNTAVTVE